MTFRELYDTHFSFVWRSLRRLGVREADLDDALQDVFLVAHRRLPDFEYRAKLTTWLFRICLRTAKDHRRKASNRRELIDNEHVSESVDLGENAGEQLERRQDLELFERALEKVDLDQRAAFVLFELEDMTGEAIAEALEIPLGTVYSRLRLARQAFKRAVLRAAVRHGAPLRAGGSR